MGLAAAGGAVVIASLALHLLNWRCPACNSQLASRGVLFCRACGAVFISGQEARSKRAPIERDLQIDLGEYRYSNLQALASGVVLVLTGIFLTVLTATGKAELLTPAWARQTYGQLGTAIAGAVEALAAFLLGARALANARRGMTVGIRARERTLQQRLASSGAVGGPAPGASPPARTAEKLTPQGAKVAAPSKRAAPAARRAATAKEALTPVRLWAVAAGANLTITWERDFDALAFPQGPEKAREGLGRDWGIHGPGDVERTFDWLRHQGHSAHFERMLQGLAHVPAQQREGLIAAQDGDAGKALRFVAEHGAEAKDGKLVAWDLVRLSFLARATFTAGWIDEAAAWNVALEAARKLQRAYGSWSELSENYLLGRGFWGEGSPESMARFRINAVWLLTSERSPWTRLPWDLPLATLPPS